jgi:hypothetical protein
MKKIKKFIDWICWKFELGYYSQNAVDIYGPRAGYGATLKPARREDLQF